MQKLNQIVTPTLFHKKSLQTNLQPDLELREEPNPFISFDGDLPSDGDLPALATMAAKHALTVVEHLWPVAAAAHYADDVEKVLTWAAAFVQEKVVDLQTIENAILKVRHLPNPPSFSNLQLKKRLSDFQVENSFKKSIDAARFGELHILNRHELWALRAFGGHEMRNTPTTPALVRWRALLESALSQAQEKLPELIPVPQLKIVKKYDKAAGASKMASIRAQLKI